MTKSWIPFAIIGFVLCCSIGILVFVLNGRSANSKSSNTTANSSVVSNGKPAQAPLGAQPAHTRGGQNATVIIEEFGDFQCPPCGALYPDLKKIEAEFGDRVLVGFRNFPLTRMHPFAYDAARAAEAAGMQGKFWEMHDKIYEHQKEWVVATDPKSEIMKYAQELGLNMEKFVNDAGGTMTASRVSLDMQRGEAMGVTGTPTVFLNGKQLEPNDTLLVNLRKLVSDALNNPSNATIKPATHG